jgi:hypothetical protein
VKIAWELQCFAWGLFSVSREKGKVVNRKQKNEQVLQGKEAFWGYRGPSRTFYQVRRLMGTKEVNKERPENLD